MKFWLESYAGKVHGRGFVLITNRGCWGFSESYPNKRNFFISQLFTTPLLIRKESVFINVQSTTDGSVNTVEFLFAEFS